MFGKYLGSLWIPTPLRGPSDPSQPGWNSSEVIEKLPVTPCFQIWKILWDEIRNPNRWKSRETGDLTHLKAALMSWAGSRSKYQKCLFLSDSSKMRISQRGNWVGNSKLVSNVRALFCHYLKLCHILLYMFKKKLWTNLLEMALLQQRCNKIMRFFALEQCTQQGSSRRQREQNNRANIGLSGWTHPITSRPLPTLTSPKMLAFHPDALITWRPHLRMFTCTKCSSYYRLGHMDS